jgi:hypothetical protein
MYRIVGADGREYGPVSAEVLRKWIAEGRANAETRVLPEGTAEWRTLRQLAEFGPDLPGQTPPTLTPTQLSRAEAPTRTNSLAVAGFALGLAAITFGLCCYGVPFNLAGIACSIIALVQIRNAPLRERGTGLAVAGLVLCCLSLLLPLVLTLIGLLLDQPRPFGPFYHL